MCKLHKAIYGLKQASRVWYDKLKITFTKLGFSMLKSDCSLYVKIKAATTIYILVYVDDILITGNDDSEINSVIKFLDRTFSVKDMGTANYFLDIQVQQKSNAEMFLSQKKYILEILTRANMDKAKSLPTPMTSNLQLSKFKGESLDDTRLYRSMVGAL